MKRLKIFLILTTLTIGSGCVATLPVAPLCVPERPNLQGLTVEQLREAGPELVTIVATNDLKLKSHIKLLEELIKAHNRTTGAEDCDTP